MEYPIFDTHAHYSARAFDADRFALLDSLPGKGVVGVCEQATHSGDAPKVLELAHKYPWARASGNPVRTPQQPLPWGPRNRGQGHASLLPSRRRIPKQ